jgi:hypothetical protein
MTNDSFLCNDNPFASMSVNCLACQLKVNTQFKREGVRGTEREKEGCGEGKRENDGEGGR